MAVPVVRWASRTVGNTLITSDTIEVEDMTKLEHGTAFDPLDATKRTVVLVDASTTPPTPRSFTIASKTATTLTFTTTLAVGGFTASVPAQTIVENASDAAYNDTVVAASTSLTENRDYVVDYTEGAIRLLLDGTTGELNSVVANDTLSVRFEYTTGSKKRINLGKFLPLKEVTVRMVHTNPADGRQITFTAPRALVAPETSSLNFEPDDWTTAEWNIAVLKSDNPLDQAAPFGYFEIDNDPNTLQPVRSKPEEYTAGVFELFITFNDTIKAAAEGLPTKEFSLGNITTGGIEGENEFLQHFTGIPQTEDKRLRLKKSIVINATIDSINEKNIALLYDGDVTDVAGNFSHNYRYAEVPASSFTWVPVGYRSLRTT